MGIFKFAMKMLMKEKKKGIFYGITLLFGFAVSFIFFNIINNPHLADQNIVTGGSAFSAMSVPFSTILSFMVICFVCFMVFFANNFFVSRKTNEIAVAALAGQNPLKLTLYILYQTLAIMLIAAPLGIGLGALLTPLCNQYMFKYLGVHASIYDITLNTYIHTFVLIAVLLVSICIFTGGWVYRNEIAQLLAQEKEMDFNDKRAVKIPKVLYLILYLFGIVMMFMGEHVPQGYIMPTLVGIVGAIGVIKYCVPDIVRRLKKGPLLTKRYAIIYISNLSYSIKRSVLLFSIMTAAVTGMIAVLAGNINSPREFITGVIGYVVIIILLVTSIAYKMIMEATTREVLFKNLWKLGYTKKELKRIVRSEVFYYYLVLFMIPLVYIIVIMGRFMYYDHISRIFVIVFMAAYLLPLVLSMFITNYMYQKAVVTPIKEAM